jgi:hypothetical protein
MSRELANGGISKGPPVFEPAFFMRGMRGPGSRLFWDVWPGTRELKGDGKSLHFVKNPGEVHPTKKRVSRNS